MSSLQMIRADELRNALRFKVGRQGIGSARVSDIVTKTAITRLHEEIEAVRREAFAEGYAAAMRSVLDFAARGPSRAPMTTWDGAPRRPALDATAQAEPALPPRPQRGTNARLVESVLQSIAPRAVRPTEIRNALRREQGVALAFTSIRHALGQLEARRIAEQVAHSRSWRYLSQEGSADGDTP